MQLKSFLLYIALLQGQQLLKQLGRMEHNIRSSFNPISPQYQSTSNDLLEQECRRILEAHQPLQLTENDQSMAHFPYLARLILNLYITLAKKLPLGQVAAENALISMPFSPHLKCSLLKLMASIIEKRLFLSSESQKLYEEASYSLFFKSSLFPLLLSVLSENTNFVAIDKLLAYFTSLQSDQYSSFLLPIQSYHLYGGGLFTIEARVFREKLTLMVESLGRVLSASDTVINRSIEDYKSNKERQGLLQESIRTAMLAKNRQDLNGTVLRISNSIFSNKEYLQKQEFVQQLVTKPIEPTLTIFLLLARSQSILFEQRSFRSGLLLRNEISTTNFYTTEMTKLFNKCPFNGDERCNCKKCQCVRRNRESAKLSQEKKRNAVQQLEAFKKRIMQLEERDRVNSKKIGDWDNKYKKLAKRNIELQEQNLMLKSLLKEMKANPNIKQHMMQTIEPVSKILNND